MHRRAVAEVCFERHKEYDRETLVARRAPIEREVIRCVDIRS